MVEQQEMRVGWQKKLTCRFRDFEMSQHRIKVVKNESHVPKI